MMISPVARKHLEDMDEDMKANLLRSIKELENRPKKKRSGMDIKKLAGIKGKPDLYRLRVGKYRVIYEVSEGTVWVSDIVKRENAYRFLFEIL